MAFCPVCGGEVVAGTLYCPYCGNKLNAQAPQAPIYSRSTTSGSVLQNQSVRGPVYVGGVWRCPFCGAEVAAGAYFCSECGSKFNIQDSQIPQASLYPGNRTGESVLQNRSVREQVYVGEVRKCPSCGAEVPSFTAICPQCGHEFNSRQVISVVQEFTEKLHEYDSLIASVSEEKIGWNSWSKSAKVWWVILNVFTFCIPILIKSLVPKKFKAGSYSQQKASFIENYVFPNEREAVLEALLLIKAQLINVVNSSNNSAASIWEKIWASKGAQLHQKAEIIMPYDTAAGQAYAEIAAIDQQYKKKALIKKILTIALIIAIVIFIFVYGKLNPGTTP